MFLVVLIVCLCMEYNFAIRNANECKESVAATATIVGSCPRNAIEWNGRSLKKNCSHFKHTCSSFGYHCVINTWMNETIEVCAPERIIIGKVCAEYNYGGKTIQRLSKLHCKECPDLYLSVRSFLYQECYEYVQNYITSKDITTLPPTQATADPSEPTLSSNASGAKDTDNHSHLDLIKITICMVSILAVAVIMLTWCFVRQRKLYKDMDSSRFQYSQKSKKYRESSRDNDESDEPFLKN